MKTRGQTERFLIFLSGVSHFIVVFEKVGRREAGTGTPIVR